MKGSVSRVFPGSGLTFAALYAGLLLVIGVAAARQGLSHYYAAAFRSGSEADVSSALNIDPESPHVHKTRGVVAIRTGEFAAASEAFEKALANRTNDFLLWLRLGYVRQQLNDYEGARAAYERSLSLAPNYWQTNYYMGKLLLASGQTGDAFPFLSKAAEHDHALYPEVLHLARKTFPDDPRSIERAVAPTSGNGRRLLARYLIKYHWMTDQTRDFLLSDQVSDSEKNEFVRYLLHKRDFQLAREVWFSRMKIPSSYNSAPIFDGGFEVIGESDESGLGWQIDQKISATAVALDRTVSHAGANSILIRFSGNAETNKPIVSQLAFLQPNRKYRLTFFVRSAELISAGMPVVIVFDPDTNREIGRSALLQPSGGQWVESGIQFTSGQAPVVRVSLQRSKCDTNPCPIFGELFLDDFSIAER